MKKLLICVLCVLLFAGLTFVGFLIFPKKDNAKPQPPTLSLGVWWWTNSNTDQYLNFAKSMGVNEIYYSNSALDDNTYEFVQKAIKQGFKVYALFGEKEWINDQTELNNLIEKYKVYQATYPNAKLSGIHLDIEPHQFADFSSNTNEYLTKFVQLVKNIVNNNPDITFDFDIPAWFDKNDEAYLVTIGETTKPAYQHIIDIANRTFVMSYRDTAQSAINFAKNELDYAKLQGKKIAICFETGASSEGDNITFFEEGKSALNSEINNLKSLLNQEYMVSVHHIKSWFNLKD